MFFRFTGYLIVAMESLAAGFAPVEWFVLLRAIIVRFGGMIFRKGRRSMEKGVFIDADFEFEISGGSCWVDGYHHLRHPYSASASASASSFASASGSRGTI